MAYTPFFDGTEAFGIPASPLTINSVVYIAEDVNLNNPTKVAGLFDANGAPIAQALVPLNPTGTMKLQLATATTPVPPKGTVFTMFGLSWLVSDVGSAYTQGEYVKINVSFVAKIN